MKFEKRASFEPSETVSPAAGEPAGSEKSPVIVYILVLFLAAFLLMLLSLLAHQRSTTRELGRLQSSVSAMQEIQEADH